MLFNPIIPIYSFTKNVWILIDIFTVSAFAYSIFSYVGYINRPQVRATLMKQDGYLPQCSSNPEYAPQYFQLAKEMERNADYSSLFGKSRFETALILYRNSLECNPKQVEAYINIAHITLQLQNYYKTNFDQAKGELDIAIKFFPDQPELYKLRGTIILCKSRRIIFSENEKRARLILEGINDLSEYLKSKPDDEHVNELKGESYYELEKINPAYIASLFLEAGSRGIGKWAEYYARKKQKYNPKASRRY